MTPSSPFLSVIVPVHQGVKVLPTCLEAISRSDLPREMWELIVVDDASTDDTAIVAGRYADTVVRLPGTPHGPAYARNRGFDVARGECIVFVDSDVAVHPDTLRKFAVTLASESEIGAVFGAYDTNPPAPGLVSQYRNLLHHYVHRENAGEAETFWAGCGAVRSAVFAEVGMYDEWHYPRPQIEDIELGHRMRARGYRIVLRPDIQGTHLKRWTLSGMVRTDFKDRGVPWMRLLVQHRATVKTKSLNLRTLEKFNTIMVWLAFLSFLSAGMFRSVNLLLLAGGLVLPPLLASLPLYRFFAQERGLWFAFTVIPLHLLYYLLNGVAVVYGWLLHETIGEPGPDATVEAFAEVGVHTWPPVPVKRAGAWHVPPKGSG